MAKSRKTNGKADRTPGKTQAKSANALRAETALESERPNGRHRGFFVAFGYSADAESECAPFHNRTGRIIKLLTVQEILDEEHVQQI